MRLSGDFSEGVGLVSLAPTNQLAKVAYLRPESWHWFFSARVLEGDPSTNPTEVNRLQVFWLPTIGIGRTQVTIDTFDKFVFEWGQGSTISPTIQAPTNALLWATDAISPVLPDGNTWQPQRTPPEWDNESFGPFTGRIEPVRRTKALVAQEINMQALVTLECNFQKTLSAAVQLSAMFAPVNHFRPEWLLKTFPGGEAGAG